MQKITPFLWFNSQAEEAVNFYLSVFERSKIFRITRYGKEGPVPAGTVMTVEFVLEGQEFVALNGGPVFFFSPAISFVVNCRTQKEIDHSWEQIWRRRGTAAVRLAEGPVRCLVADSTSCTCGDAKATWIRKKAEGS